MPIEPAEDGELSPQQQDARRFRNVLIGVGAVGLVIFVLWCLGEELGRSYAHIGR